MINFLSIDINLVYPKLVVKNPMHVGAKGVYLYVHPFSPQILQQFALSSNSQNLSHLTLAKSHVGFVPVSLV
jgi:hypothetical protein